MKRNKKQTRKVEDQRTNLKGGSLFSFLRYYLLFIIAGSLVVTVPLALVWKQSHITQVSLRYDSLQDSLAVLNKKTTTLHVRAKQLSNAERIETIAQSALGLTYPKSEAIIIMPSEKKGPIRFLSKSPFWTMIKKSIQAQRG